MPNTPTAPALADLLKTALTEPGTVSAAYFAFHHYSLGNQILAFVQCHERGIQPGPIATFPRWKELKRFVRKGQKAIVLCMPITVKRTTTDAAGTEATFTKFIYRPNWFVLAQTDGEPYTPPALPDWNLDRALATLNISRIPFAHTDGNVQGYARAREIAVSEIASNPIKTALHEAAHVILEHTAGSTELSDAATMPRNLAELEAEATAMLVCAALGLPGIEESRGYIQSWYRGSDVPESNARRILKAADQLLRAGREQSESEADHAR